MTEFEETKFIAYSCVQEQFNNPAYKYSTPIPLRYKTSIRPGETVTDKSGKFVHLTPDGELSIGQNYTWDGSTKSPDLPSNMRASLIHDAFCQLIRNGRLDYEPYRKQADQLFAKHCKEDGMTPAMIGAYSSGLWVKRFWDGFKALFSKKDKQTVCPKPA